MSRQQSSKKAALESTMIGPLWARATFGQRYPEILSDTHAVTLIEKIKALHPEAVTEFAALEKFIDEFYGLVFLVRARTFDDAIKGFIRQFPRATIINIGCGLDTTFSRIDNKRIIWFNLDLPAAIEYRKELLPSTPRSYNIAKSVFDFSWFDEISFNQKKGLFCIAGGLFLYFPEKEVATLFHAMATQFPSGEILFDMPSNLGNSMIKRRFRSTGIQNITLHFGMGNPEKQIPKWSNMLKVINWFPLFAHTPRNPKWKWKTRAMMRLNDWFRASKFIHLKFTPSPNNL